MIWENHGLLVELKTTPAPGGNTLDNVENVGKLVLEDTQLKKKQLSALTGVPDTTILRITAWRD